MSEFTPSLELEQNIRAAAAAPNPDPAFVNRLRSQLVSRRSEMQPRSHLSSRLVWRLALAVLLVLVSAVLLIGPQRIVNAMHQLFGYIPGIGMVSQDVPLRALAAPVSLTRAGITVTAQQAVLDAAHTVLVFQVDGLPQSSQEPVTDLATEMASRKPQMPRVCVELPVLLLPDGTRLEVTQVYPDQRSWTSGYAMHVAFAAIPAAIDTAILLLPCLDNTMPGTVPTDWELNLKFVPASPGMNVLPVIDIPSSTPAAATPLSPLAATMTPAVVQAGGTPLVFPYGITLSLDKAVPMADGLLLQASMRWSGDALFIAPPPPDPEVRLLDASGARVGIISVPSDKDYAPDTHRVYYDFKTDPLQLPGPVTFSIDSVPVELTTHASFTFDPGPNPQPDQTWQLNQDVYVQGQHIHVSSARLTSAGGNGGIGYSFEMQSETGVFFAWVSDLQHPTNGNASGGDSTAGSFSAGFDYAGPLPQGPLTLTITAIDIVLRGPWQVTWTPPAGAIHNPAPTSKSAAACPVLTYDVWTQALAHPAPLPAGLTGKLAFDNWLLDGAVVPWEPAVANLDGTDFRRLGHGDGASISPDGTHAAFSARTADSTALLGLAITDLSTGQTASLPGTASASRPIWSPDGKQLAYMAAQTPFDLYVINADGTDLRQVTNTSADEYLVGWTPDGAALLFALDGPNGNALRSIDLKTGALKTLFGPSPYIMAYTLSPDGKRLITTERRYGNEDKLYIYNLDGSKRRLLANLDPSTVSDPAWSPDGPWVALTISPRDDKLPSVLALFQVDTCQVLALPSLQGNITSWGP